MQTLAKASGRRYVKALRQIQQELEKLPTVVIPFKWEDVKAEDVGKCVNLLWDTSAASTWNVAVCALHSYEEELKDRGRRTLALLPATFKFKRVPKRLPKPVSEAEVTRLLDTVIDPQDLLLFEVLAGTGLRASEVAALTFGNIDIQGIVQVIGKGDKERQTFMTSTGMEALYAWILKGHIVSPVSGSDSYRNSICAQFMSHNMNMGIFKARDQDVKEMSRPEAWVYYRVKKYTKEASPHMFRHFWVTDLLANGADMMAVMDAAGHESIATTRGYKKVLTRETIALRSMHSREQGRI